MSAQLSMELVIIRPPLVYGVGAPGNFGNLTKLISKLPFLPFGYVNNKRSFISVDNLSDFIFTCAAHPQAAGETFVISDGIDVSTKEFVNEIAVGLETKLYQLPIPLKLMRFVTKFFGKEKLTEQLFDNLQIDSSKAREFLDWAPPETMAEAMKKLSK
jgi:nucleoside-diphosphate-sugar epimerase